MNGLALCSGVGGLELGISRAIPDYRCLGYVERDAFAAACLVARMEEQALDRAPIWDDISTFDGRPWRGLVDCISAGFSCQPWSSAGLGKGTDDARWIWPDIARILGEVGPDYVILENVPPLVVRGGLALVLGDLASLGFDAEWGCYSAAEAGAPHRRQRVFIMAYCQSLGRTQGGAESERLERGSDASVRSSEVANPDGSGRKPVGWEELEPKRSPRNEPDGCRSLGSRQGDVGDTEGPRREGTRWERPSHVWPPRPGGAWGEQSAHAQPAICRGPHGDGSCLELAQAYRNDRLRVLGNAVVPAQAELAIRDLMRRAGL